MRHPPLQAPLLWQTYLGFWAAGIAAAPWPLPACCCALLLAFADARLWRLPRLFLAATCLLCGLLVCQWQLYGSPLQSHALPSPPPQWLNSVSQPPRVCGQVRDRQGLPDNRLRLLLDDVRTGTADRAETPPLPGLVAWTWENPVPPTQPAAEQGAHGQQLEPDNTGASNAYPLPGQTVCLSRRPSPIQGLANEGLSDWGLWWTAQGVRWRIWSSGNKGQPEFSGQPTRSARWREALRQDFLRALHADAAGQPSAENGAARELPQGKAILLALLFGDRQYLNQQTLNNFAAATLVHSLALSGQHLTVAGLVGMLCVLAAARLRPGMYLRMPRAIWTLLVTLPPALAYLWLGNAPPSLMRAAFMLMVLAVYLMRNTAHTTMDVLCAALLCITLAWPLSVLDTGLQLSALCVAVIGMSLPWLRRVAPPPNHRKEGGAPERMQGHTPEAPSRLQRGMWALWRIFLVSLCIQAALLPLNMLLFGNMGHWFGLNVLWLPVADMLVLPSAVLGLLLSACGLEEAARVTLHLAAVPCQWLSDSLDWLARMHLLQAPALLRPHWTAIPAFAALLTALAASAGRISLPPAGKRLLLAGIIFLCIGPLLRTAERLSNDIRLDVLDVGQSQALSLRLPGHVRLLLDGSGGASPRFDPGQALVGPALTYNDAPRLSAILNSHPDLDHMGGLLYVLQAFNVTRMLDNGREGGGAAGELWADMRAKHKSRPLVRGDVLAFGDPERDMRLEILHPPSGEKEEWQGNNASVVARLVCRGKGLALFMGDAERPVLRRLLENGDNLSAEILIAPHHGSATGFLRDFYAAVRPALVVASCGFENRYGYPAAELRTWLESTGVPLLYTGRDGAVRVTWPQSGNGAFTVSTQRTAGLAMKTASE